MKSRLPSLELSSLEQKRTCSVILRTVSRMSFSAAVTFRSISISYSLRDLQTSPREPVIKVKITIIDVIATALHVVVAMPSQNIRRNIKVLNLFTVSFLFNLLLVSGGFKMYFKMKFKLPDDTLYPG